jgi:hypothetical protein
MNELEEARRALERSRSGRYLDNGDDATRELTTAIDALRRLESRVLGTSPCAERRQELTSGLNAFRIELRMANRLHQQAASWESRWAAALQDSLGLRAAAYGRDGSPARDEALRRTAWEG